MVLGLGLGFGLRLALTLTLFFQLTPMNVVAAGRAFARLHEEYFGDEYCYPTLRADPSESELSEMRERDASEMRAREARCEASAQRTAAGAVRAMSAQMMKAPRFTAHRGM